jgi:two-component system, sensor histidine kinase LadS
LRSTPIQSAQLLITALATALCLLLIAPALAYSSTLPAVQLTPGETSPDLREFVRFQTADTSTSVPQLIQGLDESALMPVSEPGIDFGPPSNPLLVLLRVHNRSSAPGTWVFSTDRGSLRYIEMFEVSDQLVRTRLSNGDLATQQSMLANYHAFAFEFSLQADEERILGLIFDAESSTKLPLSIMEPHQYQSLINTQLLVVLGATVATLTLILLNAILFAVTGKTAFFHFVIAELALVFQAVHLSGYTTIFLFSEYAELARALSGIAKVVFALFSVRFIRSFLRTRETWPRFEPPARIFEACCWLVIACLIVYPLVPFLTLRLSSIFAVIIIAITVIGLPLIAAVAVRRYGRTYLPLVLGWAVWGGYLVYTILTVYTPLPEVPYQWRWMAPLGFFEALMLSLALGLDIRKIQQSESRAQKSLSNALKNRLELLETTAIAHSDRAIAEQQLRETSSMVRSGGHDSRSFTGALKLYGQVISNSESLEKTRKYGALVSELAEQLDTTLNRIVESSSEASASLNSLMRLETMDAHALLDTVKQIHDQAAGQQGMTIRCRSNVDRITGDRHLLIRLLSNLVGNAVKYAREGDILISARHSGKDIRLEVWDQGPGIDNAQLQRLLSPDRKRQRLDPSIEGTGSGLGICLDLCEKMQATISARSQIGQGSVFTVVLGGADIEQRKPYPGISILDDPAHWPSHIVEPVRDRGMPIQFIQSFDEVQTGDHSLIIVDPAIYPELPASDFPHDVAICSYESATENLGDWAQNGRMALSKPVTEDSFMQLLWLLRHEQKPRS